MAEEGGSPFQRPGRSDTVNSVVTQTAGRLRNASISAAGRLLDYNPARGMWQATGTAIAYAPNVTDLRSAATGGENITFDEHGHSAREAHAEVLKEDYLVRVQTQRRATMGSINMQNGKRSSTASADNVAPTEKEVSAETESPIFASPTAEIELPVHEKVPWPTAIKHALHAFWKFFLTPTGFLITLYGLNVVAWGAMLFFLELHAAPAMNHPDNGNADSSPRKIWLEITSQILNALFCLTAWGLAPWRFRDLYWLLKWRWTSGPGSRDAVTKLAQRNQSWYRMRECDMTEEDGEFARFAHMRTFTGEVAPPTASWKLDFVVWMMVLNSLFQVGMAFFMWHWNRIDRPSWGVGVFIGLGCFVSLCAGLMSWWEGRKIKIIEGPKVKAKEADAAGV